MGNLCGKQSTENFSTPGRTVGSAPAPQPSNPRAQVPGSKPKPQVQGPGRTVGGAETAAGAGAPGDDPRAAAARAAEERAAKLLAQNKGKLGERLAAQKKQTRVDTLDQASAETRGARTADENAVTRSWN